MRAWKLAAMFVVFGAVIVTLGPPVLARPTLGFLSTQGTLIVDSSGQSVYLRGVNYPGYETDRPMSHSEVAYWTVAGFGFNVVRLPISWANLEPEPGTYNSTYVSSYVDQDIQWAKDAGVYIVLDMHQYKWASRFDGVGAPDWAVRDYAPNQTGMAQAVTNFWLNTNLQEHLIQLWRNLANHYANEPTVAGYDLFNEPLIYAAPQPELNTTVVDRFYSRAVEAIRSVDTAHIIFLEPANINALRLPSTANIVVSPHFYQLSFAQKYYAENSTVLERLFLAYYDIFVLRSRVPMWIGEFGAFMPDSPSRATWTQDVLTLFSRYHVGWAWWAYYGDYRSVPNQLYV